jgi:sulfofructose kinase
MAANAAAAMARLGGKVELWSRVGEDNGGASVKAGLKSIGVDVRYVQTFDEGRTSNSAIIVDDAGERMIISARDVNMPSSTSWLPLERVTDAGVVLADVRWLEAARVVFEAARQNKVPTVLDCELGGREALSELLALTDYAIFSEEAFNEFALEAGLGQESKLDRVLSLGARHAGVTLGSRGYVGKDARGSGVYTIPAFSVDVVDTTGAGDAFHGAFALAITEGRSTREAAVIGSAVAALKCRRLGARAGLPTRAELDAFLAGHGAAGG